MRWYRASQGRLLGLIVAGAVVIAWPRPECRADRVIMKNGLVYVSQGTPDKDNSLVYIWDGLKRVVVAIRRSRRWCRATTSGPASGSS